MDNDIDDIIGGPGELGAAAAAAAAGAACLSCGAAAVVTYCAACGQKHDDLRRSSFLLGKEFLQDSFGFDSRMWRTLGLMVAAPGLVPSNYSHGRRSRYTPPIRLFLVISFLFFLALSFTQTMFIAVEVTKKTPEQIAAEKASVEEAMKEDRGFDIKLDEARARAEAAGAPPGVIPDVGDGLVEVDGHDLNCDVNFKTRFFVKPKDVHVDQEAWRACAKSMESLAIVEINDEAPSEGTEKVRGAFNRVIAGVTNAIEDPRAFNASVNEWLARILFLMAPVLAIILALFIRGRDALLFDHLVLALYSHAAAFAIVGAAIIAGQLGFKYAGAVAAGALGVYFLLALKRAYKRGWIKTVYTGVFVSFLYFLVLSTAVLSIVSNVVWQNG